MSVRPPRFAVLLMRVLLPRELREAIGGDLEEKWNASRRPSRLRFWISPCDPSSHAASIGFIPIPTGARRTIRPEQETVRCNPCCRTCDTDVD